MKMAKKFLYLFVILSAALLILTGCPKDAGDDVELPPDDLGTSVKGDQVITEQPTTKTWGDTGNIDSTPSTGEIAKNTDAELRVVYFDFDKYNLRPDAIQILRGNIEYLKANPNVAVRIEGHCDERGTNEYNMALGMRRANSSRNYLIANGISASRITVRSYGEEQPVDPGHNEAAWAKNRRAEFIVVN